MSPDPDAGAANLEKIDHVIVLMLENRSFDHVFGYLKLRGINAEVDGLEPSMGNEDPTGTFHRVRPLGARKIDEKALDPGHGPGDVRQQLAGDMGGFIRNYVRAFERNSKDHPLPPNRTFDQTLVLAYLTGADVPVYDYLAREFQVCDRWFSSVPGPTWPNRLYSVTGGSGGESANRQVPIYDLKAFVRHLDRDDVSWRWYSHDPGTLRSIDSRYRLFHDEEFAYFSRKTLFERRTFLDDAREGTLPAVSWIDPNFVDFRLFGPPGSNDDHPPSPMMAGPRIRERTMRPPVRRPCAGPGRLALRRGRRLAHRLRPHVAPQDDPAPLLQAARAGDQGDGEAGRTCEPPGASADPVDRKAAPAAVRAHDGRPGPERGRVEAGDVPADTARAGARRGRTGDADRAAGSGGRGGAQASP